MDTSSLERPDDLLIPGYNASILGLIDPGPDDLLIPGYNAGILGLIDPEEQPSPPAKRMRLQDDITINSDQHTTVFVSPDMLSNPVSDRLLILSGSVKCIPSAGLDYSWQEKSTVQQPIVGLSVVQADCTKAPLQGSKHLQQDHQPNNLIASFRSSNKLTGTVNVLMATQHDKGGKYSTCHLCNKTFKSSYKLKQHMYAHSMEKPFACGICGRDFSRGSNLNEHLRIHSVAAFPCPLCINAFQNPVDRLIHVLTQACTLGHRHLHQTVQGWRCLLCKDRDFTIREHAEYHVRKHEHELGNCMFCPVCNQNFYGEKANDLIRHVKKKHRDYIESLVF